MMPLKMMCVLNQLLWLIADPEKIPNKQCKGKKQDKETQYHLLISKAFNSD
jgi:hypothetical protein